MTAFSWTDREPEHKFTPQWDFQLVCNSPSLEPYNTVQTTLTLHGPLHKITSRRGTIY